MPDLEKLKIELSSVIESDEGKQWFTTFVSSLGWKTPEEVETLKEGVASKNQELIQKNKELKEQLESVSDVQESVQKLRDTFDDFEISAIDDSGKIDYDSIEKALAKAKDSGEDDPSKVDELQRQLKSSQRDFERLEKQLKAKDSQIEEVHGLHKKDQDAISSLLIDGAFRSSLLEPGYSSYVVSNILPALRAKSKAEIQFNEEKGEYEVFTDDGKDIKSWTEWWKDTDEGKALRLAPVNSGGGGRGSGNGSGTGKSFSEMTSTERINLYKENPELYRKLKNAKK